jgi:hypothetical protein
MAALARLYVYCAAVGFVSVAVLAFIATLSAPG